MSEWLGAPEDENLDIRALKAKYGLMGKHVSEKFGGKPWRNEEYIVIDMRKTKYLVMCDCRRVKASRELEYSGRPEVTYYAVGDLTVI